MAADRPIEIHGIPELRKLLSGLGPIARQDLAGALFEVAGEIKAEAFSLAPKRKGYLRDSLNVKLPVVKQDEISVKIEAGGGAAAPYAIAVHEHPSDYDPPSWRGKTINWTVPGTGPKYLERPVHAAASKLGERLAKRVDLRRAARG